MSTLGAESATLAVDHQLVLRKQHMGRTSIDKRRTKCGDLAIDERNIGDSIGDGDAVLCLVNLQVLGFIIWRRRTTACLT